MRSQIEVDGILLSYISLHSEKKSTIVLIHGNSSSADTFYQQWSDPMFAEFRLIAFDLPAHGLSSEDISRRYGIIEIAEVLSDALSLLKIDSNFVLVGVSLGSNIVAEMLSFLKPSGIVLEGSTIIGDDLSVNQIFQPNVDINVIFRDENSKEEVLDYVKKIVYKAEESLYSSLLKDFENVKSPFRSTILSKIKNGQMSNELQLLRNSNLKPLIVMGREDRIVDACYLDNINVPIWGDKPILIANAGHLVHLDQPLEFNQIVFEYVSACFKES